MSKYAMTLVELVVVIIIVSVLSVVTVSSFSQIGGRKFKNEVQVILSDLSLARELAVTQHQAYCVNFSVANATYAVCNANCSCCSANGCPASCGCCVMGQAGTIRRLGSVLKSAPSVVTFFPPLANVTLSSATAINIARSNSAASAQSNIVIDANTGYVYVE